jgi:hypothetical protein
VRITFEPTVNISVGASNRVAALLQSAAEEEDDAAATDVTAGTVKILRNANMTSGDSLACCVCV